MTDRDTPFGTLLAASYDHYGIRLDLYGTLGQDGYEVKHALIPGSLVALTECVSADALREMSAALDAKQLPADFTAWHQNVAIFGLGGMS